MLVEAERPAVVDTHRLERGAAAREALVVRDEHGRRRVDEAAPRDGDGERPHRGDRAHGQRRADRSEQRPAFVHDSSTSADGIGVPDDAAADPEMDAPVGDREGADRERQLEVAVAVHPPERTHRRAASDGLERRDQVDRGDLRRTRHRAAGERRREQLRQPDPGPQRALDGRDHVLDAGQSAASPSAPASARIRGTHTRERSLRSRSTIITCSAASFEDSRSSSPPPSGRVPLIGIVHTRPPRRARKSSGEAETIAQPSPERASRRRRTAPLACVRGRERGRRARPRRRRTARRDAARG